MKRLFAILLSLATVGGAVFVSRAARPDSPDETTRAAALKLYRSLSDEQKALAVKDFEDKDRRTEAFPAIKRPGVPFSKLTDEQKAMVAEVVKGMTSAYGAERCLETFKETPEALRFLTYFGEPSAKKPFAWRVGMHHLTLVFAEFGSERPNEFGPTLLGGNPVKTRWDEEEKLALQLYAALSPEEVNAILTTSKASSPGSGSSLGKAGVRIGGLNDKARRLAGQLLNKRLDVLSADRRKVMEEIIQRDGGVAQLRLAIWGPITKSQSAGGSYHWRIGSDTVVCDWQTIGKNHVHMTLRARPKS
jgi:hypothetical protein